VLKIVGAIFKKNHIDIMNRLKDYIAARLNTKLIDFLSKTGLLESDIVKRYRSIAFLGGADFKPGDQTYVDAYTTAKCMAQMGLTVYNGGGPGVMRASTEGAKSAGGKVIGVTYYPDTPHSHFEGRDPQNFFDEEIVTSDYFDRTKQLLILSDIHIVFRGGTGTISEFGMAWAASRIRAGQERPIILFGAFWKTLIENFKRNMYMRPGEFRLYKIVESADEAANEVKRLIGSSE
jgi:uncharacterized protein (TIGR00725 family)